MSLEFVRSNIRRMHGYTPGEQPKIGQRVIKLNTNENPFPPSPRVMQAIRDVPAEALRRYPNPTADAFRAAAAKLLGVEPNMILAGNGSDDVLTIATRTFVPPGGILSAPEPTYSLYPVLSQLEDARYISVSWGDNYDLPIDALLATRANAIYIANPNAPTGTFVSIDKLAELARRFSGLLLIDEAYADFADDNAIRLVREFGNVVVSRTFSKAYSLAGLRFGYAVAQPQVIEEMMKVKDSYNCDAISIAAATAGIEDQEYASQTWRYVKSERARVTAALTKMKFTVLPSQANFVLAIVPDKQGKKAYLMLKDKGILVRYFDLPGLQDKLRITIGTTEENDQLLSALGSIYGSGE